MPTFKSEETTGKCLVDSLAVAPGEAPIPSVGLVFLAPSVTEVDALYAGLLSQATSHSPYGVRWPHRHPSGYQPLSSPVVNHPTQVANDMIVTRLDWKQCLHEHLATKRSSKHCIIKAEPLVGVRLVIPDLEATPIHYS